MQTEDTNNPAADGAPAGGLKDCIRVGIAGNRPARHGSTVFIAPAPATRGELSSLFATSGAGHDTRPGLAMVHGFVPQSRGHLEIESAPGERIEVRMLFAMATAMASSVPPPALHLDTVGTPYRRAINPIVPAAT